ncbi:hypothetical protein BDQ94DRAFT_155779 [Aspergillus welwitschiae]|uniref:Myb-like domain-containing protein n=1 Tax=Aspergillus welwitschiae TaxID=1341132 RepID=A0A3F3PHB1_9EURO|nr:hypothetical protein BDQ94DRAFT_155779 [Aspergillus welwitschiae]RDH26289.1 hypothetical protein BDQ94DRAFT_155779 [Aspergillus welwitschiae]
MSEDKGEKPAGEMDHPSSRLEHHGASRRGKEWSSEEEEFLRELKKDTSKSWPEVIDCSRTDTRAEAKARCKYAGIQRS